MSSCWPRLNHNLLQREERIEKGVLVMVPILPPGRLTRSREKEVRLRPGPKQEGATIEDPSHRTLAKSVIHVCQCGHSNRFSVSHLQQQHGIICIYHAPPGREQKKATQNNHHIAHVASLIAGNEELL